ncbi:MAG: IS4 family transposase [Chitinophagales bacterium]
MNATEIIQLLPDKLLSDLAVATNVNKYSKKLQGEIIFKLLLYCILSYKDNSLRRMESAYESFAFKLLNQQCLGSIKFNSISERLSVINVSYFEQLYEACIATFYPLFTESEHKLIRFDSTIVSQSCKLLKTGYQLKGDSANHKLLKFTIGYSCLPTSVHFFCQQTYNSENVALKEAILDYEDDNQTTIKIFDKGITSRKTYDELIEQNVLFISKINTNSKCKIHQQNVLEIPIETATLKITEDNLVYFYTQFAMAKHPLRCIKSTSKSTNETILFVTNIKEMSCEQITTIYKSRWEIEIFFKFIKQELNFSHLLNRSENGIKVILYITMIASILLLVYKKKNKLKGYKILKQKFVQELEKQLICDFIVLCDGNIEKANQFLYQNNTT